MESGVCDRGVKGGGMPDRVGSKHSIGGEGAEGPQRARDYADTPALAFARMCRCRNAPHWAPCSEGVHKWSCENVDMHSALARVY